MECQCSRTLTTLTLYYAFENDENNLYNIVFSLNKIELLSYSSTLAPLTSDINQ